MSDCIQIQNVSKKYKSKNGSFTAVSNVTFEINKGKILGLIGESGSGKSTIAKMIMQLEKPDSGSILLNDINVHSIHNRLFYRKKVQMVFQNPYTAINPRMSVLQILNEPLDIHSLYTGSKRSSHINLLLNHMQLDKAILKKYPHEISGGQSQRVCIARALSIDPDFLICDESLSALDLSVQAEVVNLLKRCQKDFKLGILFISHDLKLVNYISDNVLVMKNGIILENGDASVIKKYF